MCEKYSYLLKRLIVFIIVAAIIGFIPAVGEIEAGSSSVLICIDPGHGGRDPGAIGPTGLTEKEVNLDISLRLKNKLTSAGYRVVMTRTTDVYKSLEERTQFANSSGANIFISVHNNAFTIPTANGTETYYCTYSPGESKNLAENVQKAVLTQINTTNRGVKTANFYVLKNTYMVSCLLEGVFISNPTEEAKLKDASFRDKIATGIFNGLKQFAGSVNIVQYRAEIDDMGNTPVIFYPGEKKTFEIKVTNLSNSFTWPATGTKLVDISYHLYDKYENLIKFDGKRSQLPHDVKPGETVTIPVTVVAPLTSGEFKIEYDVVHEWVTWFSDRGSETLWKDFTVISDEETIKLINNLYTHFIKEECSQLDLNNWIGKLRSGEATAGGIISYLVQTEKFKSQSFTRQEFINILYYGLFDREPDDGGNRFWLEQLNNGGTGQSILSKFIISGEFEYICGKCGIGAGTLDSSAVINNVYEEVYDDAGDGDSGSDAYSEQELLVRGFIERLYSQFLKRGATQQELDDWSASLLSGENSASDLIIQILADEGFAITGNEDYLNSLYKGLFDRNADSAGFTHWMAQLEAGKTWEYALARFVGSYEFECICDDYGINPGEINLEHMFFINNLYLQFLKRGATQQELDDWSASLLSGENSASDLIIQILADEGFAITGNEDYLNSLYKGLFDRNADSAGFTHWMAQLEAGKTWEYILSKFIGSQEFLNICTHYGIKPGTFDASQIIFIEEAPEEEEAQVPPSEEPPEEDGLTVFIKNMYLELLGRVAGVQEIEDWHNALALKQSTAGNLVLTLFSSDEFDQSINNADFIHSVYNGLLEREPDEGGLTYWCDKLEDGLERLNVLSEFVSGQEFAIVCAKYTIESGSIEIEEEVTIDYSIITNNTSVIGSNGVTAEMLVDMFIDHNPSKEERARRISQYYIQYSQLFGLRADIAWSQMCHETGFLSYTGIVPPEANNFAGLGATGAKDENGDYLYNSFASEELGVIAHLIHLAWYVCPDHLQVKDANGDYYCSNKYDPRHFGSVHNYKGSSNLGSLNGGWAPSSTYTDKIIQFANEIYGN